MDKSFNEHKEYMIEYITQLKISKFIKENKDMDKEQLAKKIDEMLEKKEKMYTIDEGLKEMLRNK